MGFLDRAAGWVRSKGQDALHSAIDIAKGAVLPVQTVGAGLIDIVESPFRKDEYSGFLGTVYGIATRRGGEAMQELLGPNSGVGAGLRALPESVRRPGREVIHPVLQGSEAVYRNAIARPISSVFYQEALANRPGKNVYERVVGIVDPQSWREAWKMAEKDADPGHAFALLIGTKDITDPIEVQRFTATDQYKQWSGMVDAMTRWYLDPTVIAGKAVSSVRAARRAVPVTQEGIIAARDSTRVAGFVQRVDDIIEKDKGGAAARIRSEMFPGHAEGAYIADLLASAPDTVARRKIVGSLLGSSDDYSSLVESAPDIAHQIRSLTADTLEVLDRERGMLRPGRAEMLDLDTQALYPEVDRLAKLQATYASLDEIPGRSRLAQARAGVSASGFYQKNPLTAPVRTISNMLPQHWLNLNDARSDIQINRMLQQSRLPVERQAELRSLYMTAVDAPARQRLAIQAEEEAVQASLQFHNVPKDIVDNVLAQARRGRQEAMGALSRRKYDADGRGSIVVPGADGTVERIHLPLHVTQQANLLPLADINEIERAAQAVRGLLPGAGPVERYRAVRMGASGTQTARKIAAATDLPAQTLEAFYSVWRPGTLLRAGWPVRILGDEQLRILSKIGAMAQVKTLATGAARDIKQRLTPWEMQLDDGTVLTGRGLPKLSKATPEQIEQGIVKRGIGDYETTILARNGESVALPPAFGVPGDAANYMKRLNSSSSAFRDLVVPSEEGILRELRKGTGSWTSIAADSGEYAPAWEGAVNKQIRQSAFAREALAGRTVEGMTDWLGRTDEGIAYARQMGWSAATFESHAADVLDQVHRYVPTEGLRSRLLERDLTHADLTRAVPDKSLRPAVHGEEMAQAFGNSPILDHVRTIRDSLFKWLGQQPTDVLSRNPYFDAMYRAEGERLINIHAEAGRTLDAELLAEVAEKSRRFALNESQKLLYDLAEKSQFAHMLRFASPFYMAFQEVLTRWAGIAVDNPTFVARARLVWDSPEKAGIVTDEHGYRIDENGVPHDPITDKVVSKDLVGKDRYITLPFDIPGLPTRGPIRMNKKSMNIALSGFSFGPPVAIAVNELVKNKPTLEDTAKWALPFGATQNSLSLLLPATAKRAYALAQKEDDRQYANSILRIYFDRMTDYQLGKRPDKPTYAEAKRDADALAQVRTFTSWVLPFAPIFDSPYQAYINAYRNGQERVRKETEKGNDAPFGRHVDGTPVSVDDWFIDTYGEEYFWLTQSLSKSNDGVQPTKEGFAARERYQDLIEKHPDLGSVIIGDEGAGAYSSGVYQYQLAHETRPGSGVRQRSGYTFEEGATQPEVRLGWIKYGQAMDIIDSERVRRGLPNLNVRAAADLADVKRQITAALERKYPSWGEEFAQQDEKKWEKRIKGLRAVAADKRLDRPDRPDIAGLREYLRARDAIVAALGERKHHTLTAAANADLAQAWDTLKAAIVERHVAFAPLYYRYLERDPLETTDG